jgi:hypothetical protein
MIADLSALRMALEQYEQADDRHSRAHAERRLFKLVTPGLLRRLVQALEDADAERWPPENATTPPDS